MKLKLMPEVTPDSLGIGLHRIYGNKVFVEIFNQFQQVVEQTNSHNRNPISLVNLLAGIIEKACGPLVAVVFEPYGDGYLRIVIDRYRSNILLYIFGNELEVHIEVKTE